MTAPFSLQNHSVPASACLEALRRCGVDHLVTVPDWVQLALHAKLEAGEAPDVKLINTSNENQAVTLAAGLTLGGSRPVVVMQNQGVYNCVNTLRAVCIDARVPTVILAGQFGREYANLGQPATESRRSLVRLMEPMLAALGIPFHTLDSAADLGRIDQAYAQAESEGGAVVVLVSAPLAWN
ncbi:thiamine pyrophosphate-binding protein [Pelomonas sp. KK5]|uniref:thiamine pyrophosphate-binding protein n=1 Tax=Pelomonas sp. KK5 TaxID=1855730 RepID=UPI00097C4C51|nr:thiamine pyrophosphate-binding protein [Pelomonas sp. KK5]